MRHFFTALIFLGLSANAGARDSGEWRAPNISEIPNRVRILRSYSEEHWIGVVSATGITYELDGKQRFANLRVPQFPATNEYSEAEVKFYPRVFETIASADGTAMKAALLEYINKPKERVKLNRLLGRGFWSQVLDAGRAPGSANTEPMIADLPATQPKIWEQKPEPASPLEPVQSKSRLAS